MRSNNKDLDLLKHLLGEVIDPEADLINYYRETFKSTGLNITYNISIEEIKELRILKYDGKQIKLDPIFKDLKSIAFKRFYSNPFGRYSEDDSFLRFYSNNPFLIELLDSEMALSLVVENSLVPVKESDLIFSNEKAMESISKNNKIKLNFRVVKESPRFISFMEKCSYNSENAFYSKITRSEAVISRILKNKKGSVELQNFLKHLGFEYSNKLNDYKGSSITFGIKNIAQFNYFLKEISSKTTLPSIPIESTITEDFLKFNSVIEKIYSELDKNDYSI